MGWSPSAFPQGVRRGLLADQIQGMRIRFLALSDRQEGVLQRWKTEWNGRGREMERFLPDLGMLELGPGVQGR